MASWLLGLCLVVMATPIVEAQITSEGCGTTKGCFRSPEDCSGPGHCGYFLSWRFDADGNNVMFEMAGNVATYVAVGFSKSGQMANSDVYACTSNDEVVRSRNTIGNAIDPNQPLKGVSDVSVSMVDGGIQCTFTRQASLNDGDDTYYDLSGDNAYYIIMAKSGLNLNNGQIGYHYGGRVMGPQASFTKVTLPPKRGPQGGGDGCGSTKGCFRYPDGCPGPKDCEFFLSWAKQGSSHIFQLAGNAETYVAVGFSLSGKMSNSDVYACTKNLEVVRSRNTIGNANVRDQPLKGVSDVNVAVSNGRIECTFTRQDSLNDNDDTYHDLRGNKKYFIIMAKSNKDLWGDGNIKYHYDGRVQGPEVSFNDFAETGAVVDMKLLLQKVHGCLMIIAWVGLASIGLTTARYFKPMAPGKKPCGKPVWFTIHRFLMVLTFCCTIAAFVIIFVATEGFVEMAQGMSGLDTRFIHAILGTVVTFLAIVNPIMAFFRPHPGTPKRPLFNWAHWAVGTSAHIIGQLTICFALVSVGSASPIIPQLPTFLFWILIGFIAVHIIMWIILECRSRMKSDDDEDDDIPLKGSDDSDTQFRNTSTQKKATVRKLFFFIYLILAVVFAAIIVVFIVL